MAKITTWLPYRLNNSYPRSTTKKRHRRTNVVSNIDHTQMETRSCHKALLIFVTNELINQNHQSWMHFGRGRNMFGFNASQNVLINILPSTYQTTSFQVSHAKKTTLKSSSYTFYTISTLLSRPRSSMQLIVKHVTTISTSFHFLHFVRPMITWRYLVAWRYSNRHIIARAWPGHLSLGCTDRNTSIRWRQYGQSRKRLLDHISAPPLTRDGTPPTTAIQTLRSTQLRRPKTI